MVTGAFPGVTSPCSPAALGMLVATHDAPLGSGANYFRISGVILKIVSPSASPGLPGDS